MARAGNFKEKNHNPLGHAELIAIQEACRKLKSWRLENCEIYVSLEPCLMCLGAILQTRMEHLIYACPDPKTGFHSRYNLTSSQNWRHKLKITSHVRAGESHQLLRSFFQTLRN